MVGITKTRHQRCIWKSQNFKIWWGGIELSKEKWGCSCRPRLLGYKLDFWLWALVLLLSLCYILMSSIHVFASPIWPHFLLSELCIMWLLRSSWEHCILDCVENNLLLQIFYIFFSDNLQTQFCFNLIICV